MNQLSPTPGVIARMPLLPDYRGSVFEGWAIKYIHTNFWRVQKSIGDWEDAVSYAAWCYYDTRSRYGAVVKNHAHFMSLFKRSMWSWFNDWASWESRLLTAEFEYSKQNQSELTIGFESDLALKLREGSSELRTVINAIINSPTEIVAAFKKDLTVFGLDKFFSKAVAYSGIEESKAESLEAELRELLA